MRSKGDSLRAEWKLKRKDGDITMNKNFATNTILALAVCLPGIGVSMAEEDAQKKIAYARSAAPASVAANAAVMINGKMVSEGSNGWTCMPDTMPGDGAAMCNDAMWMKMMNAMAKKGDFKADGIGISYMLLGEPSGAGVSNSNPFHADPKNADDYVESGPHLMIIVPRDLLEGITTDPASGGPYVMWKDTPYAHIMVPIAASK